MKFIHTKFHENQSINLKFNIGTRRHTCLWKNMPKCERYSFTCIPYNESLFKTNEPIISPIFTCWRETLNLTYILNSRNISYMCIYIYIHIYIYINETAILSLSHLGRDRNTQYCYRTYPLLLPKRVVATAVTARYTYLYRPSGAAGILTADNFNYVNKFYLLI
jgi:hypothetical protein